MAKEGAACPRRRHTQTPACLCICLRHCLPDPLSSTRLRIIQCHSLFKIIYYSKQCHVSGNRSQDLQRPIHTCSAGSIQSHHCAAGLTHRNRRCRRFGDRDCPRRHRGGSPCDSPRHAIAPQCHSSRFMGEIGAPTPISLLRKCALHSARIAAQPCAAASLLPPSVVRGSRCSLEHLTRCSLWHAGVLQIALGAHRGAQHTRRRVNSVT